MIVSIFRGPERQHAACLRVCEPGSGTALALAVLAIACWPGGRRRPPALPADVRAVRWYRRCEDEFLMLRAVTKHKQSVHHSSLLTCMTLLDGLSQRLMRREHRLVITCNHSVVSAHALGLDELQVWQPIVTSTSGRTRTRNKVIHA